MSRAIVQEGYDRSDPFSTLKLVTKPLLKAARGQVVVHMKLRPINPTDLLSIRGGRIFQMDGGGTPGAEGFGIVHEVGEGVTRVKQWQRVVPLTTIAAVHRGEGSWQEYICVEEDQVYPIPDFISDEAAAQFVVNPWTSHEMVKALAVPKGKYLVQSAAGSVLGKQVIQLSKHQGIKTINIVRRPAQIAELKALGADEVICSSEEVDIVAKVKEITGGKGAWGALDAVAGTMTQTLAASVRDNGEVLLYGLLGGTTVVMNAGDVLGRGIRLRGWRVVSEVINHHAKREACAAEVIELLRDGIINTAEVEKYDLADFKLALAKAEESGRAKKILLTS